MTDERAYLAFRTGEPIILNVTGTEYREIQQIIISKSKPRSLINRTNDRPRIEYTYVVLDKNGTIVHCSAADLTETRPEPAPQFKEILLKGFVGA